eukprot:TRINITY_DN16130_c0_g1_i2.p1 TRINITY_DN16130_c0_g1~~TRINITY_DN16130_c0_g1_i2.p1  ORF type:complete len:382 (-),score=1.03 TRINITY_DN16130_c0_g1_i2:195-1250(-)
MATEKFFGYVCAGPKQKFEPFHYEPEPLGPRDVEIRVTHNGLCHTDIHMRDNDWNATTYPLVAGHEVVGVVTAVGDQVTTHKPGDRVAYGWLRDSCRACKPCVRGEENICSAGYTGLILGGNKGGFQHRLRAPADFAIRLPDTLDSVDAAPLMCAGITVYNPLRTHVTRPGMSVGVMGIGGLGHLALQMARAMGCHVTAFSTSASKEAEAKKFGAQRFVVYDPNAAPGAGHPEVPAECHVDILVNCSPALPPGGDYRNQMSLVRRDGTLVLTGIPPDSTATVGLLDVIFAQKKLAGSIVGGRAMITEMFEFCAANGIKPMTETRPLSELNKAMDDVLANKARYRYVLLTDA